MKLSEAILKGAEMTPKCQGEYFLVAHEVVIHSCALGAAYIGVMNPSRMELHVKSHGAIHRELHALFPVLKDLYERRLDKFRSVEPKVCCPPPDLTTLGNVIADMNDAGVSREEIAELLKEVGL